MEVTAESNSWREELSSLVGDPIIRFTDKAIGVSAHEFMTKESVFESPESEFTVAAESESLKDQIKGSPRRGEKWQELAGTFEKVVLYRSHISAQTLDNFESF
ncbi:Uncharacterized protein Fot_41452 [Forsythia ovata]|uniref:Uncharacterized protein n=1 Tax=Forsythia ovata TaxID=205694 RepID=A0ABD1RIC2_9LAMI